MDMSHIHSDLKNLFRMSNATANNIRMAATVLMCTIITLVQKGQSQYFFYVFQKSISSFCFALTLEVQTCTDRENMVKGNYDDPLRFKNTRILVFG